ncbi:NDMA-dependent alcohol dehydrogenase [Pseudonocardia eucalypti]|uniref:NDMA-dependent alcohol dehydrogenase n=1 Tax=Pseudonocardia eucalypti TaxID=648755 RepID=A0ABP9PEE6_9PSEU|nr:S-(hydroxymethyl)glutathione dehydrogenase/alcohol dehydrogenase [Pseudonocardia eucalypti]
MKTRSGILRQAPGKYEVVEVDLEEPQHGEVMVKLAASGMCHSDDHIATGDMPVGTYPIAGGHEGSGVIAQVGPGVRGLAEGDHVVFSFLPGCGRCRWCASGMQNLCDLGSTLLVGSRPGDPTSFRMSLDGAPVGQMAGISTFSEYTTVDIASVVKIPDDVPLVPACLLGCGVGTGWGSAVNSAQVQVGDTVIIMGIGGIGINAVQGAAHAGAANVIAVDPLPFKLEKAEEMGATHTFSTIEEAGEFARSATNGQGADSTIVTVGVTAANHVEQAYYTIRKAGTLVLTGIGKATEGAPPIPLMDLTLSQKRIQGSLFGACAPSKDILRQVDLYQRGLLKLDELITTRYTLDQVAQGYEDMHAGKNIRGVIVFD